MASAVATQKLLDRLKIQMGLHVPSNTAALIHSVLGYVDLRDYDAFGVLVQPTTVAGTGVNLVEIVAAEDANGTNATQITNSGAIVANTNTWAYAKECIAEEIAQLGRASGLALRYVGARITCDNANTRVSVVYVRGLAKNQFRDLTASVTA